MQSVYGRPFNKALSVLASGQEPWPAQAASTCRLCRTDHFSAAGAACLACAPHAQSNKNRTACSCDDGYATHALQGVPGGVRCSDIDECATQNGGCDKLTTCTNLGGSRLCGACPSGLVGNGYAGCRAKAVDYAGGEASLQPAVSVLARTPQAVTVTGSPAQQAYVANFRADLARVLNLSVADIEVTSIQKLGTRRSLRDAAGAGGVDVKVSWVLRTVEAPAALKAFESMLADPKSKLHTSSALALTQGQSLSYSMSCPWGTFLESAAQQCSACPAGEQPNTEQTSCERCPPAHASVGSDCRPCLPGHAPSADGSTCSPCRGGLHSPDGVRCVPCPGNAVPWANHTACRCAAGMYDRRRYALRCRDPSGTEGARVTATAAAAFCVACPSCFDCTTAAAEGVPLVRDGFGLDTGPDGVDPAAVPQGALRSLTRPVNPSPLV